MATARLSAKSKADRTRTHQWGRRSKTTTSPSLRSRRGKGSSCSSCGQGEVVTDDDVGVCTLVEVLTCVVVVWKDVVVRPELDVLVTLPTAVVDVGGPAEMWNLTVTMLETTSRPARSVGTVAGASPL